MKPTHIQKAQLIVGFNMASAPTFDFFLFSIFSSALSKSVWCEVMLE